jgi:AcrR family transcriptional regulator
MSQRRVATIGFMARTVSPKSTRPVKTPRPLPTQQSYDRGGLRDALVEEGRRMFEQYGASELSLRELARRLGVSEAAPSRHFRGKEELLAAIAVSGFRELAAQRAEIAARALPALPKAREMMLSYVRYAQSHAGLFDLMTGPRLLREFVRGDVEDISNISYNYFAGSVFELALESDWPRAQLHHLSHAAWSMEHGIAALILAGRVPRTDSQLDTPDMIAFAIDMFLSAVVAGPQALVTLRAAAGSAAYPVGLERHSTGRRPDAQSRKRKTG